MIPADWNVLPLWRSPMEEMTAEAIAIMCDADQRPSDAMETLLINLTR